MFNESKYVNGLRVSCLLSDSLQLINDELRNYIVDSYDDLLNKSDAVYIRSTPDKHFAQIKKALKADKHVLCESPLCLSADETKELMELADKRNLILMEAIKTAYSVAFNRLILLIKSGKIGEIVSIDATCTSLKKNSTDWVGFYEWAPTALLPLFELFGTCFSKRIDKYINKKSNDIFTKIDFVFDRSVASIKVGDGVKSEGELIISGTKGYVYVPSPWWKTDYFEIRYENQEDNKRYFYQLDGEGIRYELVTFHDAIAQGTGYTNISKKTTVAISQIMSDYISNVDSCYIEL